MNWNWKKYHIILFIKTIILVYIVCGIITLLFLFVEWLW